VFNGTFSTDSARVDSKEYETYCVGQDKHTIKQRNNTLNRKVTNAVRPGLCGDNLLTTKRLSQSSLSSQSFGKYWQLDQNNQET